MLQDDWQDRTRLLLQEDGYGKLEQSHVLVVGLGGVGSYAAEQLVRAGIGEITLVDGDQLHSTNRNRQLPALTSTMGMFKTEVLAARFAEINTDLKCHYYTEYLKDERIEEILRMKGYSYVVDAIDTLSPKIYLLYHAYSLGLPIVSAMGTGGKIDPSLFQVCDIAQTYQCPLSDILRKRLHKLGVYNGIKAVFSPERPPSYAQRQEDQQNKKTILGTVSYMPAIAGCLCASVVIRSLLGIEIQSDLPIPRSIQKKIESFEK